MGLMIINSKLQTMKKFIQQIKISFYAFQKIGQQFIG